MTPDAVYGDVAQVPGAAALALCFVLLHRHRREAMLRAYAAQTAVLALAAVWQGTAQGAAQFYAIAAIASGKAVLAPHALRRFAPRLGTERMVEAATSGFTPFVLGAGLVALAAVAVSAAGQAPERQGLSLALSVVLLGLFLAATRRDALAQAVGLLCAENGVALALVVVPEMPLAAGLSLASLALAACAAFGACASAAEVAGPNQADPERGPR